MTPSDPKPDTAEATHQLVRAGRVLAIAASALTVVALLTLAAAVYWAAQLIEETRSNNRLERYLQLSRDFDSPDMVEARARVAAALLRGERATPNDIETVLGHFETLGFLARRGLVDRRMIWTDYGEAVQCYWFALRDYVEKMRNRRQDPSWYEETEILNHDLAEEEAGRARVPVSFSEDRVKEFLKAETDIEHYLGGKKPKARARAQRKSPTR